MRLIASATGKRVLPIFLASKDYASRTRSLRFTRCEYFATPFCIIKISARIDRMGLYAESTRNIN